MKAEAAIWRGFAGFTARLGSASWTVSLLRLFGIMLTTVTWPRAVPAAPSSRASASSSAVPAADGKCLMVFSVPLEKMLMSFFLRRPGVLLNLADEGPRPFQLVSGLEVELVQRRQVLAQSQPGDLLAA